jgi:hypothetical protein
VFFRVVSNEKKNNVSVCWLVILRNFISENIEIITSDQKERLPKSKYLFFPSAFNEIQPIPLLREPLPAQLSLNPQGSFSTDNFSQPNMLVPHLVGFSGS